MAYKNGWELIDNVSQSKEQSDSLDELVYSFISSKFINTKSTTRLIKPKNIPIFISEDLMYVSR